MCSEPRRVEAGESRTIARRRHIMATLAQDVADDARLPALQRPDTLESLHCTSVVSMDESEAARMRELETELRQVEEARRQRGVPMEGTPRIPPNSVASISDKVACTLQHQRQGSVYPPASATG